MPNHVFVSENYPDVLTELADQENWRRYVLYAQQDADNLWDSYSRDSTPEDLESPHFCRCTVILQNNRLLYICSRFNYEFYQSQLLDTRERALAETNPAWGKWPEKEFEQHRCFQDLESLLEGTPLGDESLTLQ